MTQHSRRGYRLPLLAVVVSCSLLWVNQRVAALQQTMWSDSGNDVYKTNNSGNVGIGTNAPAAKLTVKGGNTNNLLVDNDGSQYTEIDLANNGTIKTSWYWDNTNSRTVFTNGPFSFLSGNLGIGTSTTASKLSVTGSGLLANFWASSTPYISIGDSVDHTTSGTKRLQVGFDTTNNIGTIDAVHQGTTSYPVVLNGYAGGNVGIGTLTPGHVLDAAAGGDAYARFSASDSFNKGFQIRSSSNGSTWYWTYQNTTSNPARNLALWWYDGSSLNVPRLSVSPGGTLEIGGEVASANAMRQFLLGGFSNDGARRTSLWQMSNNSSGSVTSLDQMLFMNGTLDTSNSTFGNPKCFSNFVGCAGMWSSDSALNLFASGTSGANVTPAKAITIQMSNGYVGIGQANPSTRLHVNGDITVSGNINAKYQDIAEWVPSTEKLSAGTVVVLDRQSTNAVRASAKSYDTRVAGVVSAMPGIVLGEAGDNKVQVATTGRVKVHVDASRGPIDVGDLLVTGEKSGTAMKSQPVMIGDVEMHRPGTLLGKALEPLASGEGDILVLLSLQ